MAIHLILISYLLSLVPSVSAKCQSFQPQYYDNRTTEYAFSATQQSFVASAIVNCSTASGQTPPGLFYSNETSHCNGNQCQLTTPPNYYIRLNRTLSISTSTSSEQNIFDLVTPYFGDALQVTDLNSTGIWPVTQVSTCINESMAAYWAYTPYYSCIEGNLTACDSASDPANGTFIRACGITITASGNKLAGGELSIVTTIGAESRPAPANATENAGVRMVGGALYSEVGLVLSFVVGFVMCFNLGL